MKSARRIAMLITAAVFAAVLVPATSAMAGLTDPRPVTLLREDFAQGDLATEGWSSTLGPAIVTNSPDEGGLAARLGYSGPLGQNLLSPTISTAGLSSITVSYRARTIGTGGSAVLQMGYFDASSTLHMEPSTQISGSNTGWETRTVTLSPTFASYSSITLVFTTTSASGRAYIDDVVVTGVALGATYTEDFQSGTLTGSGWTSSLGPATVTTTVPGAHVLKLGYTGTLGHNAVSEPIDLGGLESVRLRFDAATSSTTTGAQLRVGYFHDGGLLEVLPLTVAGDTAWTTHYAYLGSEAADDDITLVFFTTGSGTGTALVDNVFVDAIPPGTDDSPVLSSIDQTFYATSFEDGTAFGNEWINAYTTRIDWDSTDGYHSVEFPHVGVGSAIQLDPIDTTSYTGSGSILVIYSLRVEGATGWDTLYVDADYNLPGNTDWIAIDGYQGNTDGWITRVARVPAQGLDNPSLDLRIRASGDAHGHTGQGTVYVDDVRVVAGTGYMPYAGVPASIDPNLVTGPRLAGDLDAGMSGGLPEQLYLGPLHGSNSYGVAVTGDHVYWTEFWNAGVGYVKRAPREADGRVLLSATPQTMLTVPMGAFGVSVDEGTGDIFYALDTQPWGQVLWYKTSDSSTTVIIDEITRPRGMTLDASGNLYVVTETGSIIRWNRADGTIDTIVEGLTTPQGIALDGGTLYVQEYGTGTNAAGQLGARYAGGALKSVDIATGATAVVAGGDLDGFSRGRGVVVKDDGTMLISTEGNHWDQGNSSTLSRLEANDDVTLVQGGIDYATFLASDGGDQTFFNLVRDGHLVVHDESAQFDPQDWTSAGHAGLLVSADGGDWVPDTSGDLTIEVTAGNDTIVLEGAVTSDPGSDVVSGWVSVPVGLLPDLELPPFGQPHPPAPLPGLFTPPVVSATAATGTVTTAVIPLRRHERSRWPMVDLYTPAGDFSEAPGAYLVYFEWEV